MEYTGQIEAQLVRGMGWGEGALSALAPGDGSIYIIEPERGYL